MLTIQTYPLIWKTKLYILDFYLLGTISHCEWSQAINVTHNYEQYVKIPSYGDIKVVIINTACTTFVTLHSAGEVGNHIFLSLITNSLYFVCHLFLDGNQC